MDLEALRGLVSVKSGAPPIVTPPSILARFAPLMGCEALGAYLGHCLPEHDYGASGLRVLSQASLVAENLEHASPGRFIFPYGFVVVATSVGGNALAFDAVEGRVVWAAHDSFFEKLITFKERDGEWIEIADYSRGAVSRAMRLVDQDIEGFLPRFLSGEEEERLDGFDLG